MKGDTLNAELAWFHVFKAMIDDGEGRRAQCAAIAPHGKV